MTEYSHRNFQVDMPPPPPQVTQPALPDIFSKPAIPRSRFAAFLPAMAFLVADILAALCAFASAFLLATLYHTAIGRWPASIDSFLAQREDTILVMPGLMIFLFAFGGLYSRIVWEVDEIKRVFYACGLLTFFQAAFQFMTHDSGMRLWLLLVWPLLACFSVALRAGARSLPPVRRALTQNVFLVGSGISPADFAFQLRETQASPVRILRDIPLGDLARLAPADLPAFLTDEAKRAGLSAGDAFRIVLVPSDPERNAARALSERLWMTGISFSNTMPLDVPARRGLALRKITGLDMVLAEHEHPSQTLFERLLKRGFDVAVASALLVLLAPAMLFIALLLRREGPVFFPQPRVGRGGERFFCLKFRSMRPDAERLLRQLLETDPAARAEWARYQKLARDPRITRFGRFLRNSSLDELPQLINVLKGDMSLVGPRPIVAPEVPGYDNDHAYFASPEFVWYRACRPGITGLWQVSGRATTNYDERVRLDRWYVRNWSIWLDISILIRTIRVVFVSGTAS